jgi:hypothetical protein
MTSKNARNFDALLTADAAALERPVAIQPYSSFNKFRLEDGKIKISRDAKGKVIVPAKGMLEEFVELADANDGKCLEYACKWRLLELCKEHFAPASHIPNCEPIVPFRLVVLGVTKKAGNEHRKKLLAEGEPISVWRKYARFARALLNIAARLHEGEM